MTDRNEALRLADSIKTRAIGWTEWRVESPVDGGYVMVFTQADSLWPEKEARGWLELHKKHHPNSMYADYVVAMHHCYSQVEQDALDAAALLRQQAERIAELEADLKVQARCIGAGSERELALMADRDQLRAEVESLRDIALQAPWRHLDLDAVCDAFHDVIEAHHARKNPFHNPLNHRAVIALMELKSIIPYMKAIDHARTTHKDEG